MERKTVLSPCRLYRYTLWREWSTTNSEYALFVGLNPSTADEIVDDQTIRRCAGFARGWGYGGMCVANLFAYRATDPENMKRYHSPVGPDNDQWLSTLASEAAVIVAGWGNDGSFAGRDQVVKGLLKGRLSCLALTKHGQPKHPLYLRANLLPTAWI